MEKQVLTVQRLRTYLTELEKNGHGDSEVLITESLVPLTTAVFTTLGKRNFLELSDCWHTTMKPEYMVVGLNNPEEKYKNTRHNVGFNVLDKIVNSYTVAINDAEPWHWSWKEGIEKDADIAYFDTILLVRPKTGMNSSGDCLKAIADKYKIPSERIILIHDDISIPLGKFKIRKNGSAGGHNGIKSVIENLGTEEFPRIKVGIGKNPAGTTLFDYVLGDFSEGEREILENVYEDIMKVLLKVQRTGFKGIF